MTSIKPKRQYKQQVCTDKMIKNNDEVGAKAINQHNNNDNDKSSNKRRQMNLQKGADGHKFH